VGYESIGIESDPVFYHMAERAIPELAKFGVEGKPSSARSVRRIPRDKRVLSLPFVGVKLPAGRFAAAMVYRHPKIVLRQSKPTLANGEA